MIRAIVAYGDPVLKKEAEEVQENHPDLGQLIEDMWETMYEADGVGLAAPKLDCRCACSWPTARLLEKATAGTLVAWGSSG